MQSGYRIRLTARPPSSAGCTRTTHGGRWPSSLGRRQWPHDRTRAQAGRPPRGGRAAGRAAPVGRPGPPPPPSGWALALDAAIAVAAAVGAVMEVAGRTLQNL